MPPTKRKLGCTGKIKHSTKHGAKAAARMMSERNPWDVYNCYKCQHCGKYHVGSLRQS